MRKFLIAAILAAGPAFADSEARQGADWVRVTANPCKDEKVLAQMDKENPLDYRAATAEVGGKLFNACWKPLFDKEVIFLDFR
jgi:hypothetical protein